MSEGIGRRLRALAGQAREPYGWDEFRRRADSRGRRGGHASRDDVGASGGRRPVIAMRMTLAAAALVLAIAGAVAAWMRIGPHASIGQSAPPDRAALAVAGKAGGAAGPRAADVSASAERWLASRPAAPALVRVGSYAAIAGLEDRIAQLDDLMSAARAEGMQPASLSALQGERTRLVSSLAQVRYAETLAARSHR